MVKIEKPRGHGSPERKKYNLLPCCVYATMGLNGLIRGPGLSREARNSNYNRSRREKKRDAKLNAHCNSDSENLISHLTG